MSIISRRFTIISVVIAVIAAAGFAIWHFGERYHVATMLEIGALPRTVTDVDCASFGFTDVLERCSFNIDPADFPKLLAGHRYKTSRVCEPKAIGMCSKYADAGMSHAYCCGPKTGKNFHIASTYIATPSDAPHGGSIIVVTDRQRHNVMVDLYIE